MSKPVSSSAALPIAYVALRILIVLNWLGGAAIVALLVAMPNEQWIMSAFKLSPSPEAERVVMDAHARGHAWCTIVRPPTMYGERDRQFVPRVVVMLRRGLFPLMGGGRTTLSAVHASAVASGAILAARTDAAGGRAYNLTDDFPLTSADLVHFASVGLDRRIMAPRISMTVGRAFFGAISIGVRVIGRGELAAHAMGSYEWLTHDNPYVAHRARRELRWNPTVMPDVGVPEAFRWWKRARQAVAERGVGHA